MKGIRKIILLLTVVATVIACVTISTIAVPESIREENTFNRPTVQHTRPAYVENRVEVVQIPRPPKVVQTQPPVQVEVIIEPPYTEEVVLPYTEEELEILAIIVYQEAGGDNCSDDTRYKVGSVFLNRVDSPYFPDTFEGVATGKRQYGTLYLTGIKWPDRATLPEETHAVERAYRIAEDLLTNGSVLPPEVIWQAEFPQGDGIYCHQDSIYFCYSEVSK